MPDSPRAFLIADSLRHVHDTATALWGWLRIEPAAAWCFRTPHHELVRGLALAHAEHVLSGAAAAKVYMAVPYFAPGRNAANDWLQRAFAIGQLIRARPFTADMVEIRPGARYRSPELAGHAGRTQGEIVTAWGAQEGWSPVSAARAFHQLLANGGLAQVPEREGCP